MRDSVIAQAESFFADEIADCTAYQRLGRNARTDKLRSLLVRIAEIEKRHASFWREFLRSRTGHTPLPPADRIRAVVLDFLQRFISPAAIVSVLEMAESKTVRDYYDFLTRAELNEEEKSQLRVIIVDELEHEVVFRKQSETLGLSDVRDFVLGMNDGLVEILGTVAGLAAVYTTRPAVVGIGGLVVGIAGAMSMGIGAFMAVRSQREVNVGQRERTRILFAVAPERAASDLSEHLTQTGIPPEVASEITTKIGNNQQAIARILAPDDEENEVRSGLYTGMAYLFGVVFPVLPFFVARTAQNALLGAAGLAVLALAATAAAVSLLSGIPLGRKVGEMVLLGLGAAAISYGFGSLLQAVFHIPL
jgi:VIT1/CCC1 family predicted Fe2+/Mn2+ transporter